MAISLDEKKKRRAAFMRDLYEITDGAPRKHVQYRDLIGGRYGWSTEESDAVAEYLEREGLVSSPVLGPLVDITHLGVLEVEQSLEHPDRPTEHFPPMNVVVVHGNMVGSQIAAGSAGSTQSQTVSIVEQADALRSLVVEVRKLVASGGVPDHEARIIEAELATIEAQVGSPQPKANIVGEAVHSLRAIAENLVASGVWLALPGVLQHLPF